jgi:hypothetical protein
MELRVASDATDHLYFYCGNCGQPVTSFEVLVKTQEFWIWGYCGDCGKSGARKWNGPGLLKTWKEELNLRTNLEVKTHGSS